MTRDTPSLILVCATLTCLFSSSVDAKPWQWDIDSSHSSVGFVAKHLVVAKVRGHFKRYQATLVIDDEEVSKSRVDVTIDVDSIDTDVEQRDAHLKSADFFDAAKFPQLHFVSKSVRKNADGSLVVVGDLTIRGTTKAAVLRVVGPSAEFKDPQGNPHIAFSAATEIDRFDYGLKWDKKIESGGYVVSPDIAIELELELKNKRPYTNP